MRRTGLRRTNMPESPVVSMNEEWQHMFGSMEAKTPPSTKAEIRPPSSSSPSTGEDGILVL